MSGFGGNELLSALGGYGQSEKSKPVDTGRFQPRIRQDKKVHRYRPGVAPQGVAAAADDDVLDLPLQALNHGQAQTVAFAAQAAAASASSSSDSGSGSDSDSDSSSSSSSSDESSSSSSSEEEEDEADAVIPGQWREARATTRKVTVTFRPKSQRSTIRAMERRQREAEEKAAEKEKEAAKRKERSRQLVVDEVKKEADLEALAEEAELDPERPDDADHSDDEEEFEAWKLRELQRVQRDLDERDRLARERAETERRRNMTAAERAEDDRRLEAQGLKVFTKQKEQRAFLQKYHHKGAFYMDEDSIKDKSDVRLRSTAGATAADRVDRSAMPAVMQVKNFGLKGRSKWTHLAAEDTTRKDHEWAQRDGVNALRARQLPGMKGDLDGAGKRRRGQREQGRSWGGR